MLAPATRDTLELVPLRLKFVAAGTVGPTIVILLAPEFRVMLAPATRDTLLDVPLREKLVAAGTAGPITVIDGLVDSWLRVILLPATNWKADELAVFAVPLVAPPAPTTVATDTSVE